jgi:hypothetical protein
MIAPYLEILQCRCIHILTEMADACSNYLFKMILFKYSVTCVVGKHLVGMRRGRKLPCECSAKNQKKSLTLIMHVK